MSEPAKNPEISVEDIRHSIGLSIREEWDERLSGETSLADVPLYLSSQANEKTLMDAGLWWRQVKLLDSYETLGVTIPAGTVGHISFCYPITASIFDFNQEAPVSGLIKGDLSKTGGIPWHLLALIDDESDDIEAPPKDWEAHNLYAGLPQPNNLANRLFRANTWMLWLLITIWLISMILQAEKGSVVEVVFQGSWWAIGINLCLLAILRFVANPLSSFIKHPFVILKTSFALLLGCVLLIIPLQMSLPATTLIGSSVLYLAVIGVFFCSAFNRKPPMNHEVDDQAETPVNHANNPPSSTNRYAITIDCTPPGESEKNLAERIAHLSGCISNYKKISINKFPDNNSNRSQQWLGSADDAPFTLTLEEAEPRQHWELASMNSSTTYQLMDMVRTHLVDAKGTARLINLTRSAQLQPFIEFSQSLTDAEDKARLALLQLTEQELQIAFSMDGYSIDLSSPQSLILCRDSQQANQRHPFEHSVTFSIASELGDLDDNYNLTVDTQRVEDVLDYTLKGCHILTVGILADLSQTFSDDVIYLELKSAAIDSSPFVIYYSLFPSARRLSETDLEELTTPCSWQPGDKQPVYYNPRFQFLSVEAYIEARFTRPFPLKPEQLDPELLDHIMQRCREEIRDCPELTPSRGCAIVMAVLEEFDQKNPEIPFDLWKTIAPQILYPQATRKNDADYD